MPFPYEHLQAKSEQDFIEQGVLVLARAIGEAIEKRGRCILGLSGGSTPRPVYEALAKTSGVDWAKVHMFLVDERSVPPDDAQSNQRLVRETLLRHASVPSKNLCFPDTTLPLDRCVADYAARLQAVLGAGSPDVLLLGLGEDGHIASLFPGDIDALLERERLVLSTHAPDPFPVRDRITVTLPVLTRAALPVFLLKGERKQRIFAETLSANTDPVEYPAHALLETGRTLWITQW